MSSSGGDIDRFANRFIERLGDSAEFGSDPAAAVRSRFGITVIYRDDAGGDCDIDGSYNHDTKEIVCAAAASYGRRRFTILHELAHALGRSDPDFADWLFGFPGNGRLEEERVANAFASNVLLPANMVDTYIPDQGPMAYDIAQLAEASPASREAVCVRASQRLRGPGVVALSLGSVILFAATRGVPFGVRRSSDQGADSFFARASAAMEYPYRDDHVRIVFASGVASETLMADAYADDNGYIFTVLMEHSAPWRRLTAISDGPEGIEIECPVCDATRISFRRRCRVCGEHPCPDHGCSCRTPGPATSGRKCRNCNVDLPLAAPIDLDLCDMCG